MKHRNGASLHWHNIWQDIRSNWVNGNRTDAHQELYDQGKLGLIFVILEALEADREYRDNPRGTHSDDLQDLYEILLSFRD